MDNQRTEDQQRYAQVNEMCAAAYRAGYEEAMAIVRIVTATPERSDIQAQALSHLLETLNANTQRLESDIQANRDGLQWLNPKDRLANVAVTCCHSIRRQPRTNDV